MGSNFGFFWIHVKRTRGLVRTLRCVRATVHTNSSKDTGVDSTDAAVRGSADCGLTADSLSLAVENGGSRLDAFRAARYFYGYWHTGFWNFGP